MISQILYFTILLAAMVLNVEANEITENVQYFEKCESLITEVSAALPITSGEYEIQGCEETLPNKWQCMALLRGSGTRSS